MAPWATPQRLLHLFFSLLVGRLPAALNDSDAGGILTANVDVGTTGIVQDDLRMWATLVSLYQNLPLCVWDGLMRENKIPESINSPQLQACIPILAFVVNRVPNSSDHMSSQAKYWAWLFRSGSLQPRKHSMKFDYGICGYHTSPCIWWLVNRLANLATPVLPRIAFQCVRLIVLEAGSIKHTGISWFLLSAPRTLLWHQTCGHFKEIDNGISKNAHTWNSHFQVQVLKAQAP